MVARDKFSTYEAQEAKPLGRVQRYLVELRVCTGLVRDLFFLEIKELVVIVSYILIFVMGVIHLLNGLHK